MKYLISVLCAGGISPRVSKIGLSLLILGSFFFFIYQTINPPCCDALDYLRLAEGMRDQGSGIALSDIRLFGYPWFLGITLKLSDALMVPHLFVVFVIQTLTYYIFILFVTRLVATRDAILANIIYLVLCANIFIYPYLGVSLSDLIATVLILTIVFGISTAHKLVNSGLQLPLMWPFLGTLLLSVSIVVRPASVWVAIPLFAYIFWLLLTRKMLFSSFFLGALLGATPLYIQTWINAANFKVVSFLPTSNIGELQVQWGVENIKYATYLGGGDPAVFYPSTAIIGVTEEPISLSWWLFNMPESLQLLSVKLVGAFDFDFLVPYPHHSSAWSWIASILSFVFLILGTAALLIHLINPKRSSSAIEILGPRWIPLLVFASWAALTLLTAVELRFTIPILTYFMILSVILIWGTLRERDMRFGAMLFAVLLIFLPPLVIVASFVRSQNAF